MSDISETKCLPEVWHVQITKNGCWVGWYQFFHPNKAAAEAEAARLRNDPELSAIFDEVHIGHYVLATPNRGRNT